MGRRRPKRRRWPLWVGMFVVLGAGQRFGCLDRLIEYSQQGRTQPETTTSEPSRPYNRRDWQHWIDADHDCQSTRNEVLIAESTIPVKFKGKRHCKVRKGRWVCPYTGQVITDPKKLDIDHMVPLHNAHRSGASTWTRARRRDYANALTQPEHLVAVAASANRSKSDKGPEAWLPSKAGYRCAYVEAWVATKRRWSLSMTGPEQAAVAQARKRCGEGRVPRRP